MLDARDRLTAVRDAARPARRRGRHVGRLHGVRRRNAAAARSGLRRANWASPRRSLPWHTLRTPVADLAGCARLHGGRAGQDRDGCARARPHRDRRGRRGQRGRLLRHAAQGETRYASTLIAAAARRAPRLAATLYGSLAAEDERPAGAWHAEWQPLRELLRLVGGAARDAAELAEGLRVHAGPDARTPRPHPRADRLASGCRRSWPAVLGRARARTLLTELARRDLRRGPSAGANCLAEEPELTDVDLDRAHRPRPLHRLRRALTDRALERR